MDPGRAGHAEVWWFPAHFSMILDGLLMAFGLPGLDARQAGQTGLVGIFAVLTFFAGVLLAYVAVHTLETMSRPLAPPRFGIMVSIAAPTLFLAAVLTSLVTWRAGVLPRADAGLLLAALMLGRVTRLVTVTSWLELHFGPALFTGAMTWIGIDLGRSGKRLHRTA